ncbi:MAG: hypothetical protein KDA66_05845 [Planctomycetaceae bacterium]|nr:hypothetical protein [Planctomycetaceae bacterium]
MNRKTGGAIVVGAIVLGILLGQFWKIPGLGVNDPQTDSSETEVDEVTENDSSGGLEGTESVVSVAEGSASNESKEEAIIVVVYGGGYRITRAMDSETGIDVDLASVVERAQNATGDADGIRVRLLLHQSAQEGARFDLLEALKEAGLKSEQIQEMDAPIL